MMTMWRKTKWWFLGCGIVLLLALGYLFLIPTTRMIILGYYRGEPFHKGRPVSFWIAQLDSRDEGDRQKAAVVMGEMGPQAAPAVPALTKALKDPNKAICRSAALTLGQIGPAAADAGPALVEALPQLVNMWDSSSLPELSFFAGLLVSLGPEALPTLI